VLLSTSTDGTLRQWDLEAGQERQSLKFESGMPCQLQFSPEGRHVAVGMQNGTIEILRWFEK
jgi:WD40 repeat protein